MDEPYSITISQQRVSVSPSCGSMIGLNDGRILWVWGTARPDTPLQGNLSNDEGRTWSDPGPLRCAGGGSLLGRYAPALIRLRSGKLGLVQRQSWGTGAEAPGAVVTFHESGDDGETWSAGAVISTPADRLDVYFDQVIQLADGRILVPCTQRLGPTLGTPQARLTRRMGRAAVIEAPCRMIFSLTCYSDDEGRTWHRSENEVHVALERGLSGSYALAEPCLAELADGTLALLGRTMLGRSFRSLSRDRGQTWLEAEPTGMAPRQGPMSLKRLPDSEDLLVVWNMASSWETLEGLYRHRLVASLSSDGGLTYHHHRLLESLDDRCDLEPEPIQPVLAASFEVRLTDTRLWQATEGNAGARQPLDRARYHRAPGPLRIDHPSCAFYDGHVVIAYSVGVLGDPNVITRTYGMDYLAVCERFGFTVNRAKLGSVNGNNRVRVIPLSWFYGGTA